MDDLVIEISYATEGGELPEHYGYYHDVESAKDALDTIARNLEKDGE